MTTLTLFLLILALVLFLVAAAGIAAGRINLIAAGLAAWVLGTLLAHWTA